MWTPAWTLPASESGGPTLHARLAPIQTDPATIVLHPHQDLKPAIQLRRGNFAMHASRDA